MKIAILFILTKNYNTMQNKRLNDINTFMSTDTNETILQGTDEFGEDFSITFDTIELLDWLDIEHMKNKAKTYITNL
tara:strand:+ start:1646 stop:1876 length:231 start_codon:yes stop_codon:yes gene_type:complete